MSAASAVLRSARGENHTPLDISPDFGIRDAQYKLFADYSSLYLENILKPT